ncbi:MAG: T9SS type A sorting domain-containing protein [Bacteroidales bacterium]
MKKTFYITRTRILAIFCIALFLNSFTFAGGLSAIQVTRLSPSYTAPKNLPVYAYSGGNSTVTYPYSVYPGDKLKIALVDQNGFTNIFGLIVYSWHLSISGFNELFLLAGGGYPPSAPQEIYYTVPNEPKVSYSFSIIANITYSTSIENGIISDKQILGFPKTVIFNVKPKSGGIRPPGVDSIHIIDSIYIRPLRNPVNEVLPVQIDGSQAPVTLELFDASGNVKKTLTTTEKQVQLNVADLKKGRYILRGKSSNGQIQSKHVIIE